MIVLFVKLDNFVRSQVQLDYYQLQPSVVNLGGERDCFIIAKSWICH